jgi:xanthine dehydrogenase iron-sulfur cluster and FAD-binding subunit A
LNGKQLIIVEDLVSENGKLHPVQDAMVKFHGSQCGFCTPGFLVASQALLDSNPSPSNEEISEAIEGNLCRCTGYQQIVDSIQEAAKIHRGENDTPTAASEPHPDPHPSGPGEPSMPPGHAK